jgi:hypothetical protein
MRHFVKLSESDVVCLIIGCQKVIEIVGAGLKPALTQFQMLTTNSKR